MTGVLITFDLASLALLIWSFVSGFQPSVRQHILIALGATAFTVFSHSMTMMYVAAVGRMIRQTVEKAMLDRGYVDQTKGYRSKVFRVGTVAMVLIMLQTILGGGTHTRMIPAWVHLTLGIATLLMGIYSAYVALRYLIANHLLGHRVAREYERQN